MKLNKILKELLIENRDINDIINKPEYDEFFT